MWFKQCCIFLKLWVGQQGYAMEDHVRLWFISYSKTKKRVLKKSVFSKKHHILAASC